VSDFSPQTNKPTQAQPTFFTEIIGNTLHASDGIGFFNEAQSDYAGMVAMCNIDYAASVPWVRGL
jgi:hypothetical protein